MHLSRSTLMVIPALMNYWFLIRTLLRRHDPGMRACQSRPDHERCESGSFVQKCSGVYINKIHMLQGDVLAEQAVVRFEVSGRPPSLMVSAAAQELHSRIHHLTKA
jgi:hypothetical protein